MYVLGIFCYHSNSSASLVKDNKVILCAEEERFSREKYTGAFPVRAIDFCLKQANISFKDIDHVVYCAKPWLDFHKRILLLMKHMPASLKFWQSHRGPWLQMIKIKNYIIKKYKINKKLFDFGYINHHIAHSASAFYVSGFDKAAILSIDGCGEWATTMLSIGDGTKIIPIKQVEYPHSLGYLYASIAQYLGFRPNKDEGKIMGLAPYGKPTYCEKFKKIAEYKGNGDYVLNLSYFDYYKNGANVYGCKQNETPWYSKKFVNEFGPPRKYNEPITQRHMDTAYALQNLLEDIAVKIVHYLYEKTRIDKLCIAGGVGLNSVMNTKILIKGPFKDIFIQPAANDGGVSFGGALYKYFQLNPNAQRYVLEDAYLGPEYSNEEIKSEIDKRRVNATFHKDIEMVAAKLLAEGKILGWFQGCMEFGPRALGNRSILTDPRRHDMKDILNYRVKHREAFRPFAPAILEERIGEYFEFSYPSPFMLLVYKIKKEKQKLIPAVTHVDGTGRVQTVTKQSNPKFYNLLVEFEKLTDIPVILNTSFNVQGEPIVNSPKDALGCFYSTGMDALIMGNYLLPK